MMVTNQSSSTKRHGPVLGYSSLGLPLWGAWEAERESVLDAVLGDYGYDLLELHIETTTHSRAPGTPVLDDAALEMLRAIAAGVRKRRGRLVLGLGARFLLGPTKHEPSLIHRDPAARALRLRVLEEAVDVAADLDARALIFLSGTGLTTTSQPKWVGPEWARLESGIERLLVRAEARRVVLAPEAHSAHLFSTIADVLHLQHRFPSPYLGFTADTAHQTVTEGQPLRDLYRQVPARITHLQLDNVRSLPAKTGMSLEKKPLDLPGLVDVAGAISGLLERGYSGAISVEFLRHDYRDVDPLAYCERIARWLKKVLLANKPISNERAVDS
jgi:sugar phosphate isomerase/epimerase